MAVRQGIMCVFCQAEGESELLCYNMGQGLPGEELYECMQCRRDGGRNPPFTQLSQEPV